jgi:hypothetical protein
VDPDEARTVTLDVGPFELAPGEETDTVCFSFTLDNERTLNVARVAMSGGYGFHHSNWLFVPDQLYQGPDGVWPCRDRGFDAALAALTGGVLFAQSTQAPEEVQEFGPGVVIQVPPRSRLVANLHLLNAGVEPLTASSTLEVEAIPERDVEVALAPFYLQYLPLRIPPHKRSRFSSSCDLDRAHRAELDRPLEFSIYYLLPHYHVHGDGVRLEVVGGPDDGALVFENQSAIGEALGHRLDPPYDLAGADGLRFGCQFTNSTDRELRWGIGDHEMCILLGFARSELIMAGGVMNAADHEYTGEGEDGAAEHEGDCTVYVSRVRR